MSGTVYLVGAGPGAPDLLTLRAARLLERADVVFHDALVHPETLALAQRAQWVPVGKRCGRHSIAQRFISKRLVDAAARHAVVVRLKGGDPMLFGRGQEEIAALEAAQVAYEIVPGISAAMAAAAQIGTSLTQRGSVRTLTLATPRVGIGEAPGDWARAAAASDACAIYMGAQQAPEIAAALIAAGHPPELPVAIVEDASSPASTVHYTTLRGLPAYASHPFGAPTLLLAGPQFRRRPRQCNRALPRKGDGAETVATSSSPVASPERFAARRASGA